MADAAASVDPAALADVIRRCEAAVASWDPLGDIETRACLGKSADFPTAIRDAAPLVLAVERQLRDEGASRGDDAAALDDENLRVAPLSLVLTSCGFATLNYALPVGNMARVPARDRWTKTARRMGRSEGFARFFFAYCLSNLVFWPSAFVLLHPKLKGRPFEDNYFVYTN